jgi:hypothetical protein
MNLTTLKDTPPWEWPNGTAGTLLDILRDDRSLESDLLLELAGDFTVINDEPGDAAPSVGRGSPDGPARPARASAARGPGREATPWSPL